MNAFRSHPWLGWMVASGLLVLMLLTAFALGKYPVSPVELGRAVLALAGWAEPPSEAMQQAIWWVRLPRILAGLAIGAVLAAAGAAYQGMFRNPLVSPDILGVSSGAGLGASAAIFIGLPLLWVQGFAFVGGLLAVGLVYGIASLVRRHDPVLVLVLVGVVVGAMFGAGISLLKILADPYSQLPTITFWLLGGLNDIVVQDLLASLPLMLAGVLPLALLRWRINLLSLSDEEASALGVNVTRLRAVLIMAATLATSASVALAGIVGWVGLLVPHLARLWVGPNFSRLLPASMILGAGFLVGADTLARTAVEIELPLGIVTSLLGAPFFLVLLARGRRHE